MKKQELDPVPFFPQENHEESEEQELTFNLNVNNYLEEKALVFCLLISICPSVNWEDQTSLPYRSKIVQLLFMLNK